MDNERTNSNWLEGLEDPHDSVNHPEHYAWLKDKCGIEPIDITRHLPFDLGNAVKYILRAGRKRDAGMDPLNKEIEDLRKAVFYLNDYIENMLKPQQDGETERDSFISFT